MRKGRIRFDSSAVGTAHTLVGPSEARACLWVWPPATGNVTVSNDPSPTANNGVVLQLPGYPLYLTEERDGDVVHQAFFVVYSGTFAPCSYLEVQH